MPVHLVDVSGNANSINSNRLSIAGIDGIFNTKSNDSKDYDADRLAGKNGIWVGYRVNFVKKNQYKLLSDKVAEEYWTAVLDKGIIGADEIVKKY